MDDETEDDAGYPPNPTTSVHRSSASSSHYYRPPQLLPPNPNPNPNSNSSSRSSLGPSLPADRTNSSYHNDDVDIDEEEEEEEEEEEDNDDGDDEGGNAPRGSGPPRAMIEYEEEEDGEDDVDQDISGDEGVGSGYPREREKYNYEFAARASPATVTAKQLQTTLPPPPPLLVQPPQLIMAKPLPADWSESATQVLLDIWGDKFVQLGRKSLRSDEWLDVVKKVSAIAKIPHLTDAQCRNRLDTLKKKYKREKAKLEEYGSGGNSSRWIYFKRMEALMGPNSPSVAVMATPIAIIPPTTIQTSAAIMAASLPALSARKQLLACGLDSGEYVFSNTSGYPNNNKSNDGLNNVRDSSDSASDDGNDDDDEDESDDSDCPPPKKVRYLPRKGSGQGANTEEGGGNESGSFGLLAESIQKFGEIYERVENSKRQQLMEIERMRMEFQKDLEMQKRQILERAQAEIARIKEEDDNVNSHRHG